VCGGRKKAKPYVEKERNAWGMGASDWEKAHQAPYEGGKIKGTRIETGKKVQLTWDRMVEANEQQEGTCWQRQIVGGSVIVCKQTHASGKPKKGTLSD